MTKSLITSNMRCGWFCPWAEASQRWALPNNTRVPVLLSTTHRPDKRWPRCQSSSGSIPVAAAVGTAEPGIRPGSWAGAAWRHGYLPEMGWKTRRTLVCPTLAVPTALCSPESSTPAPAGLILAVVTRAAAHHLARPQPSAPGVPRGCGGGHAVRRGALTMAGCAWGRHFPWQLVTEGTGPPQRSAAPCPPSAGPWGRSHLG